MIKYWLVNSESPVARVLFPFPFFFFFFFCEFIHIWLRNCSKLRLMSERHFENYSEKEEKKRDPEMMAYSRRDILSSLVHLRWRKRKVNIFGFICTGCISFRAVRRRARREAERGSSGKEKYTGREKARNALPQNNRRGVSLPTVTRHHALHFVNFHIRRIVRNAAYRGASHRPDP